MKKMFLLTIAMLLGIALLGCSRGSYSVINGQELNSSTRFSMIYDRFNGFKEKDVTVEVGEPMEISVSFTTISGKLDSSICRKDDSEVCDYQGNDVATSSFTVTLTDPGTYVIRVDADRHSGSYSFSW